MDQSDNQSIKETQTPARKILDFLIGFLGSLIGGNIGLLLFAQVDPQRMWIWYFKWFWIFVLAGLAVILYTKKRVWISFGVVAAGILMAF